MKNITMNTFVLKRADKQDLLESALLLKLPNKEQSIWDIFENIQYGIVIISADGSLKWYNSKANLIFTRIWGVEILSSSMIINSFFDNIQEFLCYTDKLLICKVLSEERSFLCCDCTKLWLDVKLSSISINGDILLSFHEITNTKNEIQSLKQYEAVLSAISYASETFINMVDLEESIIAVLEKLGKATGVSRIQLFRNYFNNEERKLDVLHEWVDENCKMGKENSILSSYSYRSLGLQRWEAILSRGDFIAGAPFEFDKAEKDSLLLYDSKYVLIIPVFVGKEFWGFIKYDNFVCEKRMTETEINALYSVGQTLGAAIQKINFEKEIIIAKDAAEKSDRLKTEFLAQMSHEIRTPINSILCFTSLLESELLNKIPDELKSCFDAIDNGGRRLIRTIDMILNMSQFQTDSYEANYQIIDLNNGFLENILEEFKPAAQAKGLIIDFKRTGIEAYVLADPYTLEQIFSNLLDNAIKFTNHGQIVVSIYQNIDSSICVDVSDTGVGISNEYIPNLFTPFSQEEMGYTRKYEGNGLGLALVKKYLEINRASILVDSKKGIGSTFTVLFRNN